MSFEDLKREVAIANRILTELGLANDLTISRGHVSLRIPEAPDRFIVKGRGYEMDALPCMRPEDMVVCDLEGYLTEGPPGVSQCFEVKIHSCIYRTYPEVRSVVHVHPTFTVLMGSLKAQLRPLSGSGGQLVRNPVPVFPHSYLIQSEEDGMGVAGLLQDSKAVLLRGHGAVTTGRSMEESVTNMLELEKQARLNWYALCAFGPDYPCIEEEMFIENAARPSFEDEPHFKETMATRRRVGRGGMWAYYSELVSKDL